ncbi:MAG TPA: energy transducer TonB [Candidatus Sulfotelmatobacter sp.]
MFAESMLETSRAQRARRSWTTLTSFGLQALIIGCLLLLPLWRTIGRPGARTVSTPISLGRVAVETAPTPRSGGTAAPQPNILPARFMQPTRIPRIIQMGSEDSPPGPVGVATTGIEGMGLPSGSTDGLLTTLTGGVRPILPTIPAPVARVVRISSMLEGNLTRRVQPVYPPLARTAHVQGSVVVYALISKAGTMVNVHAISGHPMLVPAAVDAVSQWRYRPYILNSEPIEVETQITVNFYLAGN